MPMSTSRAAFYTERYYPVKHYNSLYELTLEEAKDIQDAERELQKLLLDASENVTRLYAEVRPGKFTPQALKEVSEAQLKIEGYEKTQAGSKNFAASLRTNPVGALKLGEVIDAAKVGPGGTTASDFDSASRVIASLEREAKKYSANPDLAQKILVEGIAAARKSGINFGANPGALNNAVQRIAGSEATLASVQARVASAEGRDGVAKFQGGGGEEPADVTAARQVVDASRSPFANGKLEGPGHVASGIDDEQDQLLKLYLQRLQDEGSPGTVTKKEFEEANPGKSFEEAKKLWEKVSSEGSYLKTSAEWFNQGYLSAVRTEDEIRKKVDFDEFDGLSPQQWAAREAFDRGGYTAEDIHYLAALRDAPNRAELVRPAYARAREGLEPKTELEKVIAAAYEMNPDLSVDEIESYVDKAHKDIRQTTRQAIRTGAVVDKPGARKAAREEARGIEPKDVQAAKAYLVALKLPPDQVSKTPIAPPPTVRPPSKTEQAAGTVEEAKGQAQAEAQRLPTPTPATPPVEPEATAPSMLSAADRTAAGPELEGGMLAGAAGPSLPPTPEEDMDQVFQSRIQDPNTPELTYQKLPSGGYAVYRGGPVPTGEAKPGTRAFESIDRVARGLAPLPAVRPPKPTPEEDITIGGGPVPVEGTRPQATPEAFRAKAASEADPVRKKALEDAAARMEKQAPAPAPAPVPAPAPAPAPSPKAIEDMTDEELQAYRKSIGGR